MTANPHPSARQEVLRFQADIGFDDDVTAFISHSALSARYGSFEGIHDLREMVAEHRRELDQAVARRINGGCRQPVVLRASDLCLSDIAEMAPDFCV
ncbi:MAG: hypothetical protein QFE16_08050 [Pseudomonadota bacterium]|nr:hypothetical protein [Pseudomonadota bacterium]